ncbi:MAG TPA: N-acetyltransferase [Candidatus Wallbacteria bacterium]|nr:N-acetyltransferase [Candidatus Wallbacteria bacterium]
MNVIIRREEPRDYRKVEELTRKAFWNMHAPGCDEHYLVHVMREHEDFISELDLVMELDGAVIGSIMYTRAKLVSASGKEKSVLTFGPVSVAPEFQRKGLGKKLMERSFEIARTLGYEMIVIFGNPSNYVSVGFKSCRRFGISLGNEIFPAAMLVKELVEKPSEGEKWTYRESPAYNIDKARAEIFDAGFEPLKKEIMPSQEEFFILSNSRIITEAI